MLKKCFSFILCMFFLCLEFVVGCFEFVWGFGWDFFF